MAIRLIAAAIKRSLDCDSSKVERERIFITIINLIINQMKSIKLLATFLMLLFFAGTSFAQSLEVSGTVSDSETGETLPFAYVQIKGTTTGTQTDMDGRYTIETPANATLVESEAVSLDDVLVVAYGTAKKESFTGSAEVIKSDKLEKRTVANVTKALTVRSAHLPLLSMWWTAYLTTAR